LALSGPENKNLELVNGKGKGGLSGWRREPGTKLNDRGKNQKTTTPGGRDDFPRFKRVKVQQGKKEKIGGRKNTMRKSGTGGRQ